MNQNILHAPSKNSAIEAPGISGEQSLSVYPYRNALAMLLSAVSWTLAGTAVFFAVFALLAPDEDPFGTLIAASLSGACGIVVCSLWLRRFSRYKIILALVIVAYALRVLVGVYVYLDVKDSNYFNGNGAFPYTKNNAELYWTYDYAMIAKDIIKGRHVSERPAAAITRKEDKNLEIHYWMGSFMAVGDSRHALDLAPFNAFHHAIAGFLVISIALACSYPLRVSWLSGVLTAWIPWGFAASMMWRDSVGFSWVVMSVVLICIGKELGLIGSLLMAVPASFLSWANRSPYLMAIVVITFLSILYDQQKALGAQKSKLPKLILASTVLIIGLFLFMHSLTGMAFERHQGQVSSGSMSFRLLTSPLLVLRALAGPFPWFVGSAYETYTLFDYLYHVLQFALFLIYVVNWRSIVSRMNILTYAGALFWVIGFIAGGVHTAYLALAFPFVIPQVLNTESSIVKYLAISAFCFVVSNVIYVSLGLVGSGFVIGTTGY